MYILVTYPHQCFVYIIVGTGSDVSADSSLGLGSYASIGCRSSSDSDLYSSIDLNRSPNSDTTILVGLLTDSDLAVPTSCLQTADCVSSIFLKSVVVGFNWDVDFDFYCL